MNSAPDIFGRDLAAWPSGLTPYFRWRAGRLDTFAMAEKHDQAPPESLLQQVWLYQRVLRERLQTIDGRPVKILHPGFWNREAGPDFRRAVVQIGSDRPVSGDVEIDIVAGGWDHHAHAGNPAYRDVVLHVTWEPSSPRNNLPTLPLKHALDSTVPELSFWLGLEPKPAPDSLPGKCSGPLRALDQPSVKNILRQAAQARLRGKAEQMQAAARQAGWDGALWEGLFAALGYKRNTWPMRRLAQSLPVIASDLPDGTDGTLLLQSRLFGLSGLLPSDPRAAKTSETYLRAIWDGWWRDADRFTDHLLPRDAWNLAGIRPANHPQRRLACAAHWVARGDLPARIEKWLERRIESPDLVGSLEEIVQAKHDPFWSHHWTLRSAPFAKPQPLLGEQRITDLAMNVVLPWLYLRAWAGRNEPLASAVEARYFLWPAGEDNTVLRLARQRLFGGVPARFLKTAAEQQGLMQIVRDFCGHSNAACDNCGFPGLLKAVVVGRAGENL